MTSEEIIKLVLETTGQEGLKDLATNATEAAKALATVAEKADQVEKKTLDLATLQEKGQGLFSAFQSGELPGIIQGVGDLVGLVPGLNAFAPAIKKVGEVSQYAWPLLKDLYKAYSEGAKDLKDAVTETEDYGERVDALGETIKNLTDQTASLNVERARGNKLLEEETTWVEKLATLRSVEEKNSAEQQAQAEAERAGNLQSALGGKQEAVVEGVALGMHEEEEKSVDQEMSEVWPAGTKFSDLPFESRQRYYELAQRATALQKGIPGDIQARARKTTAGAMIGGKESSIRETLKYLPKIGRGSEFRKSFKHELPEEKAIRDQEEAEGAADVEAMFEDVKRRDAFNKESRELEKQGKENEEHMREKMEHDAEVERKETDKAYQQSLKEAKELEKKQEIKKPTKAQQRQGMKQIQLEQAAVGNDINAGEALQEFNRRWAELQTVNAMTTQTLLNASKGMVTDLDKAKARLAQAQEVQAMQRQSAKATVPANRTNQDNGWW